MRKWYLSLKIIFPLSSLRFDYHLLFEKMSPLSSPERWKSNVGGLFSAHFTVEIKNFVLKAFPVLFSVAGDISYNTCYVASRAFD